MAKEIHVIEEYVYNYSAANKPSKKVNLGDTVILKTKDCFTNQITSEEQLVTTIDFNHVNPATGPVYVNGAEPGDLLVVDIVDIKIADQGVTCSLPGVGPLHDQVETRTRILPIKDGIATFNDITFPVDPMIGVIGVAPKEGEFPSGHPGDHGGNLDNKKITAGARLYFPVHHPGALFQCGDLHANMGDGEIIGTGIEIAGEVTVTFQLIKQMPKERPILETDDYWYTIAPAPDYPTALKRASEDMQQLLVDAYGWDKTDAGLYMSLQGDVEICQACTPCELDLIVRFGVPKRADKPLLPRVE